ncbi:serine peptidase [Hydrogenovibrio sp. SC-1]|uniref:DegQ family serine endoprotease n=1 Tax=Hydrogenovibrio sp. SC-1 TaxID=2065820 RepID=UPI000C7A55C4|nr:DegQ family serine endoprotease [Hydrogenovibrio sp. SC-1]PLA74982.1 serine peptidase [Hydrogenovibrio sp. SC-1]
MKARQHFNVGFLGGCLLLLLALNPALAQSAVVKHTVTLPDFSQLAEENSPVVVNISTLKKIEQPQVPPQFRGMPEEMLRYFFGIPNGKGHPPQGQAPREQVSSLGSGFIISEDGYIITNHHVVADADDVIVKLNNRRELKAKVVGSDERSDIALLKIEAEDLPVAKIGSSEALRVGQWVMAIGEPFGLDYTVTHGIVSALGRSLPDDTYVPFIQTDVPINPGNSGGPLLNMQGEVVGVNAQIYSRSGGSVGLSFSIPIDIAMDVAEQLKEKGRVVRGFLGVGVQEVSGDLAKSFNMERPMGALVTSTGKNSAAAEAGIEPGDIIVEFDGRAIEKSADLPPVVGASHVNTPIEVKVLRNGSYKSITVRLKSLDETQIALNGAESKSNRLGVVLESVPSKDLTKLNLPFGVGVAEVEKDSAAHKAGILPGDILVTMNFKPAKSISALMEIIDAAPKGRSIPVRIVRGNRSVFLPLVLN